MAPGKPTTIVLGAEYDANLRKSVLDVLQAFGAEEEERTWCVGGSQEVTATWFKLADCEIVLESETYVGLSLTGDADLVQKIAALVRAHKNPAQ